MKPETQVRVIILMNDKYLNKYVIVGTGEVIDRPDKLTEFHMLAEYLGMDDCKWLISLDKHVFGLDKLLLNPPCQLGVSSYTPQEYFDAVNEVKQWYLCINEFTNDNDIIPTSFKFNGIWYAKDMLDHINHRESYKKNLTFSTDVV